MTYFWILDPSNTFSGDSSWEQLGVSDDVMRGGGGEVEESEGRRAESSGGRAAGWGAQQASAGFLRLLLTQLLTLFFRVKK